MVSLASLQLLVLLRCLMGISSFSPRLGRAHTGSHISKVLTPTSLQSATMDPTNEDTLLAAKKDSARGSLENLLRKQRRDLQETETLIRDLADNSNNSTKLTALTKSILSGFDYGFVSRSEGCRVEKVEDLTDELFVDYGPPANGFSLGKQQLIRNLNAIKGEYKDEDDIVLSAKQKTLQDKLDNLTLSSAAIWEREEARGEVVAPFVIKIPYYVLCYMLDIMFKDKNVFSRFFLLETVARMPYFSYITMLHLYETLGFWRRSAEQKRVHFAEEWNEFHHLLIMESLGGDQAWWVRFLAQHSALVYFLVLTHLFALSPSLSYKFSELLETHAVDTYSQFLDENEEQLKELPPSLEALEYYTLGISDPMFGEYQTTAIATGSDIRKSGKDMQNLFAVFTAICADEGDHVGTMKACLDPKVAVLSPALESRVLTGFALASVASVVIGTVTGGDVSTDMMSTELFEGIDGATIVDGIMGGAAALFGGLGESDVGDVVEEEFIAAGGLAYLSNFFAQVIPFLSRVIPFL